MGGRRRVSQGDSLGCLRVFVAGWLKRALETVIVAKGAGLYDIRQVFSCLGNLAHLC